MIKSTVRVGYLESLRCIACLQPLLMASALVLALTSCKVPDTGSNVPEPDPETAVVQSVEQEAVEQELQPWEVDFRRQRLIGDLLYDALKAMNEDRLLYPVGDNAHDRYRRVLALEPDNQVAGEGLQNIVDRYLELAATASRQGRFAAADQYIDRARFVDRQDPAIRAAQAALEADRNSGDPVYELDLQELDNQSPALVAQLAEIADQAVSHRAFVWITAPTDEKGRWIYGTLRQNADGYRLRGNIELGGRAIIRLRLPEETNAKAEVKPTTAVAEPS